MATKQRSLRIGLIGFGAIGKEFLARIDTETSGVKVIAVAVSEAELGLASTYPLVSSLSAYYDQLDLVVEAAGHSAIEQHVLPALKCGINAVVASVGALASLGVVEALEAAAREGGAQVQLIAGAIGAIDALTAAKVGGLSEVTYVGRKAPLAWSGTQAESLVDLAGLTTAQVFFRGSAREAAQRFPKNANVAATVALAGLGLDQTQVQLIADPAALQNVHQVVARGAFGEFELTIRNLPLVTNPKTSALTVYSLLEAVKKRNRVLSI